jgi:nucleoside-diphosphate-sugar epimerase
VRKTILLIGASGSLGQAVSINLAKKEQYKLIRAGRSANANDELIDICDHDGASKLIKLLMPDVIINLATIFSQDFEESFTVNVGAVKNILNTVQQEQLSTRVILIGSAAEYGNVNDVDNPVSESQVLKPLTAYGLSKAWQTQLASYYFNQGVDVIVARIFNLLAPDVSEKLFAGRVYKQIKSIAQGKQDEIQIGPLSAIRDYISTKEAAEQLMLITEQGISGEIYHVASGRPISMQELLRNILEDNGLEKTPVKVNDGFSNHKGVDLKQIYADINKTNSLNKN